MALTDVASELYYFAVCCERSWIGAPSEPATCIGNTLPSRVMKVTGLAAACCSSHFCPPFALSAPRIPALTVARQLVSGSLGPPLSRSRRTRPFGCRHSADSSYRSLICWRRLRCAAGPTRRTGAAADQFAANVLPIVRAIQTSGVTSLAGIAEALNARGVRTARGGAWHASTVRNLLARSPA